MPLKIAAWTCHEAHNWMSRPIYAGGAARPAMRQLVALTLRKHGTAATIALLAETCGNTDEAARLFEDAIATNERAAAWPSMVLTQLDYARMLLARGSPDDRGKATELLERARAMAETLGMPRAAEQASSALDEARGAVA